MQIEKHTVVSIDYTLTNKEGIVLDSSKENELLSYIHGVGNLIVGLEKELEGKSVGDAFKVSIPPDEGYGFRDDSLIEVVGKDMFQGVDSLETGMQFQAPTNQGVKIFSIVKIEGDEVTVDGNHPLAGETLNFDVKVMNIREATDEELAHGHAHGPGGAHH
jgi:FKBP-type peptidyl-prolyl cis-trans isomerase SlyD